MSILLRLVNDQRGEAGRREGGSDREEQFLKLFLANQKRLHAFILAVVPVWSDADDLLQETSAVLWRKWDEFQPGTDFVSWALQVARYEILKFRKKQRRDRCRFTDRTFDLLVEHAASFRWADDERRDALELCLAKLNDRDRELIRLRYQPGATTQEVADRAGRSLKAIYKALGRIHDRLLHCVRQRLAGRGLS